MIEVTTKAAERINKLIKEKADHQAAYLRLAVHASGCSGLSYRIAFDNHKYEDDQAFTSNGVEVVVDPNSLPYLDGSIVDYRSSNDGLTGEFEIKNPNATSGCGCGHSFNTKK